MKDYNQLRKNLLIGFVGYQSDSLLEVFLLHHLE
jgi:hypothetical protein